VIQGKKGNEDQKCEDDGMGCSSVPDEWKNFLKNNVNIWDYG